MYWLPQNKPYRLAFLVLDNLTKSKRRGGHCIPFASLLTSEYLSPPTNTVMTANESMNIMDLMSYPGILFSDITLLY